MENLKDLVKEDDEAYQEYLKNRKSLRELKSSKLMESYPNLVWNEPGEKKRKHRNSKSRTKIGGNKGFRSIKKPKSKGKKSQPTDKNTEIKQSFLLDSKKYQNNEERETPRLREEDIELYLQNPQYSSTVILSSSRTNYKLKSTINKMFVLLDNMEEHVTSAFKEEVIRNSPSIKVKYESKHPNYPVITDFDQNYGEHALTPETKQF